LGFGILANVLVPKELKRLRQERSQAEVLWRSAQDAWVKQSGTQQFADAKRETDSLIQSLSDLPNEEKRQLQILEQKKREYQLTHHLERFVIANSKIPKIGSARKAVLRSFGIETAADINRRSISGIQGFGPTLVSNLLGWQQGLVARFVFNPNEPINPRDLSALKARIASRKSELEAKIRGAVASLQQASNLSLEQRRKFAEVAKGTFLATKQAELNEKAATSSVQKASKFISIGCACFAVLSLMIHSTETTPTTTSSPSYPPSTNSSLLCRDALDSNANWDTNPLYRAAVEEAKRRGYSVADCRRFLGLRSTTPEPSAPPAAPQSTDTRPTTTYTSGFDLLCREAISYNSAVDWNTAYPAAVEEAKRRGYSVADCRRFLGLRSTTPKALQGDHLANPDRLEK
jgi:hypothetical protein